MPHAAAPALLVIPAEFVLRSDEGVAREYQQVLEGLVPAPLRLRQPGTRVRLAVGGRDAAVVGELVVVWEHRRVSTEATSTS